MAAADPRDAAKVAEAMEKIGTVSRTALLVAHDRALESERPDGFFRDPWARLLAGSVGEEMSKAMAQHPFACNLDADGKPGAWPEYHQQWTAVRTRFIDELLAAERAAGTSQIVCLGAGVDMRAFRLECLKGSKFIEVETGEMHGARATLLEGLGAPPLCERASINCDVTDAALQAKLESEGGFDASKPTVWILEGLLMYLPKPAQDELLRLIGRLSAPGSCAVINFLFAPAHGAFGKADATALLRDEARFDSVEVLSFGEPGLSFGRYREGVAPDEAWSFAVCRKAK